MPPSIERFKVMERKLYYGITTPGGVLTLVLGIWMLADYAWAAYGQMHVAARQARPDRPAGGLSHLLRQAGAGLPR